MKAGAPWLSSMRKRWTPAACCLVAELLLLLGAYALTGSWTAAGLCACALLGATSLWLWPALGRQGQGRGSQGPSAGPGR